MTATTYQLHQDTLSFLNQPIKMLINGKKVSAQSGKTYPLINPATGEELAQVPFADAADVDVAVREAKAAFDGDWSKKITPDERGKLLWKVAELIERDAQILAELETLNNGKPLSAALGDIADSAKHFRYYAGWATKIEGSTIPVSAPNQLVYIKREPLGVVGQITPWNFPLCMAAWKISPAIACGNTVVIKPSEQTPLTTIKLAELFMEAGFPPGVLNVVTGFGLPAGEAITTHPMVAKVGFTGSTAVGTHIMSTAAKSNLKKVSLELGGKSPNVIFADADLESATDNLPWSSFFNTGQECTLGSRVYVQQPVFDEVLAELKNKSEELTVGNGLEDKDLGPMITEKQMNRVLNYIEIGQNEGAEVVTGGQRLGGHLQNGYFLPPTIFSHNNDHLKIVQEEIFGPVVVIAPFKNYEEVIQRANNSNYGLAAAIWTKDIQKAHRFANDVQAGTVWINSYDLVDAAVPFGGYKQSGIGREMGKSALELYTQEKAVWVTT